MLSLFLMSPLTNKLQSATSRRELRPQQDGRPAQRAEPACAHRCASFVFGFASRTAEEEEKEEEKKHVVLSSRSRMEAQVPYTSLPFHKMEDVVCNIFALVL